MTETRRGRGVKRLRSVVHYIAKKHNITNTMNEQLSRNLKFIAWVVAGLVVVGFLVLWIVFRQAAVLKQQQAAQHRANPVAVVPNNQLPAAFPPNIPIEAGAAVTDNFNAAASNGQFQATRSFRSGQSIDTNFALYQKFLANNTKTWTVISQVNSPTDPNNKSLFAKGSAGLLTIAISALPPQPFPASLVTITYITNPASAPSSVATPIPVSASVPTPKPATSTKK